MSLSIFKKIYQPCFYLCLCVASNAQAGEYNNLAVSLAGVRGEVEELQVQLDLAKESHRNQMSSLVSQLSDLGVEERRQKITIEKLQQSMEKLQQELAQNSAVSDGIKPVVIELIAQYRSLMQKGFPFKVDERLSDVDKLGNQLNNDLIDAKKAANRLWAFIEDEIRLSKENGIYQQTITLNDTQVLADIAKLGTALMYFQTGDKRVGKVSRQGLDAWIYLEVTENTEIEQINLLFDSLKKQIRQGYFELPNPLKPS